MRKIEVDNLKKFLAFLNHTHLSEVIESFHNRCLVLSGYSKLTEDEVSILFIREIDFYIKTILQGAILDEVHQWIADLREGNLYRFNSFRLDYKFIKEIILIRKQTFIHFLPEYSKDVKLVLEIVKELDCLSSLQQDFLNACFIPENNKSTKTIVKKKDKLKTILSKMQKILRFIPAHVNVYDIDKDQAIYSNGAGHRIFDHTAEDVMAARFSEMLNSFAYPEDREKIRKRWSHFKDLKDGEIDQLEYRLYSAKGEPTWFYSRATVFKRVNGKVKQVLLTGLNITELKKSEEERVNVESQLYEAQKIAHIGSYDWDILKDILTYTDEAYKIYDFPRDKEHFKIADFKGKLKEGDVEKFEDNLKRSLESGVNLYEGEYRIVLKNKSEKDIVSRAKIMRDKEGKPVRMQGTVMDVTSVKKAEYKLREKNKEILEINQKLEASQEQIRKINRELEDRIKERTKELKDSEERYRLLAENVPHLFWTTHAEGGMNFYNNNVYRYTGKNFDELKEWKWESIVHPDDLPRTLAARKKSLKEGTEFEGEFRIRRADGVYRWHLGRSTPLKDKHGNIVRWMGSATDIDEQKRYSEELKMKNKQLIKTNKDLDNFIYTASHDLKAPISNIEGLLNIFNAEVDDKVKMKGENFEILKMIDSSVGQFKKTIMDLTEITSAQKSGEGEIQENVIEEIFNDAKAMVRDLIETSGAEIKTDFESCSVIKFSKKNLRSIVYNLLSNAIKFRSSDRRPQVFIKTECIRGFIVLTVADNGVGFEPDQQSKIFEMFKRLHSHTEGTGVGLYLVKRIVTNAGGKIEVESEKGAGSTFRVYFKS